MKIFVINLKRSPVRRDYISKRLTECGLSFTIFEATDGSLLTQQDLEAHCDLEQMRRFPNWLTKGAMGCALSKVRLFTELSKYPDEKFLILEDDVVIPDNFKELASKTMQLLENEDFGMLYWQCKKPLVFESTGLVEVVDGVSLATLKTTGRVTSGACFVLSGAVAGKIARANSPVVVGSDAWADFYQKGCFSRIRCLLPCPLVIGDFPSDKGYGNALVANIKRAAEFALPPLRRFRGKKKREINAAQQSYVLE